MLVESRTGEIVTLIGGNGAGKSTMLRTISGLLTPKQGTVSFVGNEIQGESPHRIAQSGLIHVPEGRGIFANLTVDENLQIGAYSRTDAEQIRKDREMALDLFPRVRERLKQQQELFPAASSRWWQSPEPYSRDRNC